MRGDVFHALAVNINFAAILQAFKYSSPVNGRFASARKSSGFMGPLQYFDRINDVKYMPCFVFCCSIEPVMALVVKGRLRQRRVLFRRGEFLISATKAFTGWRGADPPYGLCSQASAAPPGYSTTPVLFAPGSCWARTADLAAKKRAK